MDKDFRIVSNRIIYKYASIETAMLILKNKQLMFSNPNIFNDPFDCYEGLINTNTTKQENDKIIKEFVEPKYKDYPRTERRASINDLLKHPAKFRQFHKQLIVDLKNRIGVSCFSMVFDNILLWSHYADKHKGVCLGFLISPVKKSLYALYPVKYKKVIEPISCFANMDDALKHWLLTKAYAWKYEKEIRAISLDYNGLVDFSDIHLKQIYLGCKIDKKAKNEILGIMKKDYSNSEIFQMSIDNNNFGLRK